MEKKFEKLIKGKIQKLLKKKKNIQLLHLWPCSESKNLKIIFICLYKKKKKN